MKRVCLVLVLSDWRPTACAPLADALDGRFAISVELDSSTPRLVAVIVPDDATLRVDGTAQEVVNNVWFGRASAQQQIVVVGADGTKVQVELGSDI